jgi:hypothetical protein
VIHSSCLAQSTENSKWSGFIKQYVVAVQYWVGVSAQLEDGPYIRPVHRQAQQEVQVPTSFKLPNSTRLFLSNVLECYFFLLHAMDLITFWECYIQPSWCSVFLKKLKKSNHKVTLGANVSLSEYQQLGIPRWNNCGP